MAFSALFYRLVGGLFALGAFCQLAGAQSAYPERSLRLVVPFPAGGPTDVFARLYAAGLSAELKQPIVVENKVGAAGAIGAQDVARAAPDGYSMLFGTATTHSLYPVLNARPLFDVMNDFEHVAILGGAPLSFAVHPSQPNTLAGLVANAKAEPGKLSYGSPGIGTLMHLTTERLKLDAGAINIVHVPYRGAGPAMADLVGNHIPMIVDTLGTSLENHRAGRIRILAVATAKRSNLAPEIPTVDEALGTKGFAADLWNVVSVPKGVPADVLARLGEATRKVMADASLSEKLKAMGIEIAPAATSSEVRARIADEQARWRQIVSASGIKIE